MRILKAPLDEEDIKYLQVGEEVLLEGTLYTARDMAHKRMCATIEAGGHLPIDIRGQIIYYTGPCPAPANKVIGSAGPTTSNRMDSFTEALLARGLKCMVGKGSRNAHIIDAIKEHKAIYLVTIGGAGAYLARQITRSQVVAYEEFGPEAIRRLEVKAFPAIVAIDIKGNNIFTEA
ncbi:MAG TPA: FumA C-terminus/TtdB family hydratase beta subunit [Syntrophomonadaceae bacterium]|nr:FumA C-terminus/TtdB family hydratase beta subunit [Syntrophomonadaceae bacterium]